MCRVHTSLLLFLFARNCSWTETKVRSRCRLTCFGGICRRRGQRSMSSSRTSSPWSLIKRPSVCGRSSPGKASSHRWKDSGCQWSSNSVPRRPPKVDNVLEWQILVCAEWLIVWRAQWQSAFQEINPSCIINLFFFFLMITFINSITVHVLLQRTHESRVAGHIARTTRKHTHKSCSLQCKSAKINGPKNRILVFINLI